MPRTPTRARTRSRLVRERAGLTLIEAAKRVGVTCHYLARCERTQTFSYTLALRCAALYGRLDDFRRRTDPGE